MYLQSSAVDIAGVVVGVVVQVAVEYVAEVEVDFAEEVEVDAVLVLVDAEVVEEMFVE